MLSVDWNNNNGEKQHGYFSFERYPYLILNDGLFPDDHTKVLHLISMFYLLFTMDCLLPFTLLALFVVSFEGLFFPQVTERTKRRKGKLGWQFPSFRFFFPCRMKNFHLNSHSNVFEWFILNWTKSLHWWRQKKCFLKWDYEWIHQSINHRQFINQSIEMCTMRISFRTLYSKKKRDKRNKFPR